MALRREAICLCMSSMRCWSISWSTSRRYSRSLWAWLCTKPILSTFLYEFDSNWFDILKWTDIFSLSANIREAYCPQSAGGDCQANRLPVQGHPALFGRRETEGIAKQRPILILIPKIIFLKIWQQYEVQLKEQMPLLGTLDGSSKTRCDLIDSIRYSLLICRLLEEISTFKTTTEACTRTELGSELLSYIEEKM